MKLYFRDNVYGWAMTGLVGKGAKWFFGFSRAAAKGVSHIPGLAAGVKGLVPVPAWCPTHQHHKWCEHNGGVRGSGGWGAPASGVALPADKRRSDVLADRAPDGSRYDSMCPAGVLGTGSAAGYTTAEFSTLSNQAHGYGVAPTHRR